jgi:hypothetical protein
MVETRSLEASIRQHTALIAFVAVYLAGFGVYGLNSRARLTTAYAVIVAAAAVVVARADTRVRFSAPVLWCLGLWGAMHMAGGLIEFADGAVLYNVSWGVPVIRYDRVDHAFGFGTTCVVCWEIMRNRLGIRTVTTAVAVVIWLGGMGFGALNETVEFVTSRLTETNVGGYVNTGWDLIANTFGCTLASAWLRVRATVPTHRCGA